MLDPKQHRFLTGMSSSRKKNRHAKHTKLQNELEGYKKVDFTF